MKAGDIDAIVALYAPDADVFASDMMAVHGIEKIRAMFTGMHEGMKVDKFEMTDVRYLDSGDVSVSWGMAELTVSPKAGGASITAKIRFTAVAKKIDGKWLYISDHASAPMTGPPPTATK